MSELYSTSITAHPNIYVGAAGRELRIDFCTPDLGVNEQTGLLILVPGFGGNIDSHVYKKMREEFADQHNLVTIQCNYFGSSYMAICHGPQILISAQLLLGRRATCYNLVADELKEAGAFYEDREVVVDGNLITSRQPGDLPAFMREVMKQLEL